MEIIWRKNKKWKTKRNVGKMEKNGKDIEYIDNEERLEKDGENTKKRLRKDLNDKKGKIEENGNG